MCLDVFNNLQLATTPVCPEHCAGLNFNICFSYLNEFTEKSRLLGPDNAFVKSVFCFILAIYSCGNGHSMSLEVTRERKFCSS